MRAEPVRAEPVRDTEPQPREPRPTERSAEAPRERGHRERGQREREPARDDKVVGMGDHLPDFIALSFDKRRHGDPEGANFPGKFPERSLGEQNRFS